MLTDTERGLVAGILMSEGSFGGDGKQPHVILRKHVRHESLMRWLVARFPRSRLYGPYHHGERSYFQWVARGPALVEDLLPVLEELIVPELDSHAANRLLEMRERYAPYIARVRAREADERSLERRLAALARALRAVRGRRVGARDAARRCSRRMRRRRRRITEPGDAIDAHVADALVALELDEVRRARRIADLGSGAGFPGLVLAAALPDARVALVEASVEEVRLPRRAPSKRWAWRTSTSSRRAPSSGTTGSGRCDLVTARAVAPLNVIVEYAAPLLAAGGALVAWKGRREQAEERDGDAAAAATGLSPAAVRRVRPWAGAEHLHLHLYLKVDATPDRYPRRPGMASKRPVRAST